MVNMSMRISDYVYETLLGCGTFGSVYLVRRKKDCKPFVVKEQVFDTLNALPFKNILGEVQALYTLRHPNIVSYYGAWIENNYCYILMEYATRCTLKHLLEKRQLPLQEEDALYLFSQIVLGVHHIHFKELLHRDLKPENIMLTGSRGDIVKIGDFGVSKNFREYYSTLTDLSTMCRAGSFYYMAPEMLKGHPYDYKCDIWSMGVVLYEMVTKKLPFSGKQTSLADIVRMTCEEKPRNFQKPISEAVVNLISKMLRKDPLSRPKTDQLVLCPLLMPFIIRIHLNLGRTPCVANKDNRSLDPEMFLKFVKPQMEDY